MIDVPPEIGQQLIRRRKSVLRLDVADMPMIAFPGLVVVAQHTHARDDIGQRVLEPMNRSADRFWRQPDPQFDKRIGAQLVTFFQQQLRFHDGQ